MPQPSGYRGDRTETGRTELYFRQREMVAFPSCPLLSFIASGQRKLAVIAKANRNL